MGGYTVTRLVGNLFTTGLQMLITRGTKRVVFHQLQTDHQNRIQLCQPAAA
jgi:hypothetical protein